MNFDEALMLLFPQVKRIRRQFMTSNIIIMLEDGREFEINIHPMNYGFRGQQEAIEYYADQICKKLTTILPTVIDNRNQEIVE